MFRISHQLGFLIEIILIVVVVVAVVSKVSSRFLSSACTYIQTHLSSISSAPFEGCIRRKG